MFCCVHDSFPNVCLNVFFGFVFQLNGHLKNVITNFVVSSKKFQVLAIIIQIAKLKT